MCINGTNNSYFPVHYYSKNNLYNRAVRSPKKWMTQNLNADVILLLKVIGGSVNIRIAIKYFFIWSMRKNPVEESNEHDSSEGL